MVLFPLNKGSSAPNPKSILSALIIIFPVSILTEETEDKPIALEENINILSSLALNNILPESNIA